MDECNMLSRAVLMVLVDFAGYQKRSTCNGPASSAGNPKLMTSHWGW